MCARFARDESRRGTDRAAAGDSPPPRARRGGARDGRACRRAAACGRARGDDGGRRARSARGARRFRGRSDGRVPGGHGRRRRGNERAAFPAVRPGFRRGFASRVPGVAHLCGHDLHTAIGVGVARALAQGSEPIRGRLVFVFQPAEEPLQGARAMLETGLVQRLAPREFYALHCSPFPCGTIGVSPGYGLPGLDHIRIVLPDGDDAAVAALTAEMAQLGNVGFPQSIAEYNARFRALLEPALAASIQESVCVAQWTEQAPDGQPIVNVLLRVWPQERHAELRAQVKRLAAAAGGTVEFPGDPFPAMVNSAELSTAAGRFLSAELGPESVVWARASWPFNCEDFALFLNEAPGAQFYLGVADAQTGMNGAPHTPDFAADERAIGHGVRAMSSLLIDRLAAGKNP
ncbi:MAG TPA: M20/M25/M40 family metallo-hydrolase [Actinocrinis sp.]|nr:M20/M25/M40 family metallo-hydrolase [Actinocrinis sp.]HZP51679.1 M20/M25/M40 family metallo-hydrolase [Actinocrinis sp.]